MQQHPGSSSVWMEEKHNPSHAAVVSSALQTLHGGLEATYTRLGQPSSISNSGPVLLEAAHTLLQLSTAAVGLISGPDQTAASADTAAPYSNPAGTSNPGDDTLQHCCNVEGGTKPCNCESSSEASSSPPYRRRSSLRSSSGTKALRAGRRSVSFNEDQLSVTQALTASQTQVTPSLPKGPAASIEAATVVQPAAVTSGSASSSIPDNSSELLLELPRSAAGLLCDALSGSSPVCLELDIMLCEAGGVQGSTTPPAAAAQGSRHSHTKQQPSEQQQQQGGQSHVRTPSGRVLRRSVNDSTMPLSPSGKEVWGQLDAQEELGSAADSQLLHVLEPHIHTLLELAVSYCQLAALPRHQFSTQHTAAGCADAAGQLKLHTVTEQRHGPGPHSSLHEWRPLSPSRQGRYQRCLAAGTRNTQHLEAAHSHTAASAAAGHDGQQCCEDLREVYRAAASCLLSSLQVLAQHSSVLSRLCEKVLDVSHVANLLAALCEAAAGNSAALMQQAAELLVRLMTAPCANRLCDQLRHSALASILGNTLCHHSDAGLSPEKQQKLRAALGMLHSTPLSTVAHHTAGVYKAVPQPPAESQPDDGSHCHDVDPRLAWSLRSADSRQLPPGVLALAAEAAAAQQRSSRVAMMTEARLAALLEGSSSSNSSIKLLGWGLGPQGPPVTNIQLVRVAGSTLGTGSTTLRHKLWEVSSQHEALAQQAGSKASRSSTLALGVEALPIPIQQRTWTDSSSSSSGGGAGGARVLTASAAAAVARDRLYYERLHTLLGSAATAGPYGSGAPWLQATASPVAVHTHVPLRKLGIGPSSQTQLQYSHASSTAAAGWYPQLTSQQYPEDSGVRYSTQPAMPVGLHSFTALPVDHGRRPHDTVLPKQQSLSEGVDKCCTMTSCCGCCCG